MAGPIVLIHGSTGGSWRDYAPLLPLLEAEREIVVLRTPGHYEAEELPDGADLTIDAFADRLESQLDEHGLEQADIVGESTGGLLAIELGRRGRARALVAISPAGMWTEEESRKAERSLRWAYRLARRTTPFGVFLVRNPGGRYLVFSPLLGTRGAKLDGDEAGHVIRALADSQFLPAFIDANKDEDGQLLRVADPDEVRCPVLVVWGDQDKLLPVAQGRRWQEALPEAELQELTGVGHHPHFDEPERIAEMILEFLGRPHPARLGAA